MLMKPIAVLVAADCWDLGLLVDHRSRWVDAADRETEIRVMYSH
jgi:hypothetical protein